jgi:DNA-directed RNA polymerase specialized sigma24 family protein
MLQIPEGTVKSRVHEARNMLKDRLIAFGLDITTL